MVVLTATCVLGYPADVTADSALEYAVFDPEAGTLEMVFGGPSTYGNLTLRPDGADSFRVYEINAERQNVLDLDAEALEQFDGISCPRFMSAPVRS